MKLIRWIALLPAAAIGLAATLFAQTSDNPTPPLNESLATEAAAKGETDAARASLEGALGLALAQPQTLAQIRDAGHWHRAQISTAVETRLNRTRAALADLRTAVADLPDDARGRVQVALSQVDTAETELQAAIRAARSAEEPAWTSRRDRLSTAYEVYATTVLAAAATADSALAQAKSDESTASR